MQRCAAMNLFLFGGGLIGVMLSTSVMMWTPAFALQTAEDLTSTSQPDNVLIIVLDQLRYDTLGFVQKQLKRYEGKLQIRTPNIDALAQLGVSFAKAYCQSPSCGPSRATLKTGTLVARSGLTSNKAIDKPVYSLMAIFRERVERLQTLEQVMKLEGYQVETYGKWHFPLEFYKPISFNNYDYKTNSFQFAPEMVFKGNYRHALRAFKREIDDVYKDGDQQNKYSKKPYTPIQLDPRYGMPTDTPLSESAGLEPWETGNDGICGRDSLSANYTSSGILGDMALKALDRLLKAGSPFLLSVHFNSPHPPMVATGEYLNYYWKNRSSILTPPSLRDSMIGSAYAFSNDRKRIEREGSSYKVNKLIPIAELTAVYYAMIEEIDKKVGLFVERITEAGAANNTLIVFTSDHGELLGSHGMTGKGVFLEEASRVPLIMVRPGMMTAGLVVREPVSHLDLLATVLDYIGTNRTNNSDGKSLRRFIDHQSFNHQYDERVVVLEWDTRYPLSSQTLSGKLGDAPNFMIRKGDYKLLLPRKRDSPVLDMLYNLERDPFEMKNLLHESEVSSAIIGKAEHLKILLLEFLQNHNGNERYFSSNKYHLGEGMGDIQEIKNRRTWKLVTFWQSDQRLSFGVPSMLQNSFRRAEYLYFGSTTRISMGIQSVLVQGPDAKYFSCVAQRLSGYWRVRVFFSSTAPIQISTLNATVVVKTNVTGHVRIPIVGES